jgi:Trk-type K+ transport system membrane component
MCDNFALGLENKGVEMAAKRGMHPARLVAISFTAIIAFGTLLLSLPLATNSGKATALLDSLFTATSAVTVTGLSTLDVETHWNMFGHIVIALLVEVGGFGIVGFASLIAILIEGRISLRNRITTSLEAGSTTRDVRGLLFNVISIMLTFQALLFGFLFIRFIAEYSYSPDKAAAHAVFHAVSAFNNAGFALYSDGLARFATDGWILIPVFMTVLISSFGFPTIGEIRDRLALKLLKVFKRPAPFTLPKQWSLNSRITLWGTLAVVAFGILSIGFLEWNNARTFGGLTVFDKGMNAVFTAIVTRTAGFNSVDLTGMHSSTWLVTDLLMFIGGASVSTSGGIKIGTAVVLFFIVYSEVRGEAAVNIGNRRLPRSMQRQAIAIVALTVLVIAGATMAMRLTTNFTLDQIMLEVFSAVGTGGITGGVTPLLPDHAKFLVSLLMLFGRLGPIVVATSLALRTTKRHFEYPRERPLIG